jgi:hypothetical protein
MSDSRSLEKQKKMMLQDRLRLRNTRVVVAVYREAQANELNSRVLAEMYRLVLATARMEWGEGTTIDDYSVEGKFVIQNKDRRAEV